MLTLIFVIVVTILLFVAEIIMALIFGPIMFIVGNVVCGFAIGYVYTRYIHGR